MNAPRATYDFKSYKGVLPYASELFGVYQPLLGWKSKRIQRRLARGLADDPVDILTQLARAHVPQLTIEVDRNRLLVKDFGPGQRLPAQTQSGSMLIDALRHSLSRRLEDGKPLADAELDRLVDLPALTSLLKNQVAAEVNSRLQSAGQETALVRAGMTPERAKAMLAQEGKMAAALLQFKEGRQYDALRKLLAPPDWQQTRAGLLRAAQARGPLDQFVPKLTDSQFDLDRIALSPIGVVHLFRQYFFELDSFLGSPVGHVWVSPGTHLELIEMSTRRVVVEKSLEQSLESTRKSEQDATDQDELAEAVKQDNQQEIKFGASVSGSFAGVTASSSFNMNDTQKEARETAHKHMRQQSTKLSTEIKASYKTTFKTVTETTSTTSRRYVIDNTSDKLQNYELRRKMRQVAVQVQDVGSYLCWQTFVDRPGDVLDLASLVHVAQPADLDSIPHPEKPEQADAKNKQYIVEFPYQNTDDSEGHEMDVIFTRGSDQEGGANNNDRIVWQRDYHLDAPALGYALDANSLQIASLHSDVCVPTIVAVPMQPNQTDAGKVRVSLEQVNFADRPVVKLQITATWNPPAQDLSDYNKKMTEYNNARARAQKEAYHKAVRERITLASKIAPRPADELREEERIVVFRKLIQEMLMPKGYGTDDPDPVPETKDTLAARHVLSELINSIFDVDKMLYFVAPEWWKPHASARQGFGPAPRGMAGPVSVASQVGWDNKVGAWHDHYFITEDSAPAKLGSSLGWTLQLDGDNLRNAFLNAPWVKAVMPIRPGKEKMAIAWLKHVEGFNGIGPGDLYSGDGVDPEGKPLNGRPLTEVLDVLAETVTRKHQEAMTPRDFDISDPQLPHDPDSTVTATPVDRVWEHGFNPLAGGFQSQPLADPATGSANFQIFDQWVEILPTDQVVPVVVEYDPKTGRLREPPSE